MINIFKPQTSKVVKGLEGKSVLIYGDNRTGKTSNLARAEKPIVAAFEYGLEAIDGVPFLPITSWRDWRDFVTQLTDNSKSDTIHDTYKTIIVDTVDAMLSLGADFICTTYGISSIGEDSSGKKGWGRWTEYRAEVSKWILKLTNAGFTVMFIGHTDTRKLALDNGEEYLKIFPRGDKKSIDFICDLCGLIGYARSSYTNEEGKYVNSTLYLKDTMAFKAGGRYDYLPYSIPEWTLEKLDAALVQAITEQEKATGIKAISAVEDLKQKKAASDKKAAEQKTAPELIEAIGNKVRDMIAKDGNKNAYDAILEDELHNKDFRAQEATEKQIEQLEIIYDALVKKGY